MDDDGFAVRQLKCLPNEWRPSERHHQRSPSTILADHYATERPHGPILGDRAEGG